MSEPSMPAGTRSDLAMASVLLRLLLAGGIAGMGAGAGSRISRAAGRRAMPRTPAVMRDLAERLLPVYQEPDPDRYLAESVGAANGRRRLRGRRRLAPGAARPAARVRISASPSGQAVVYDMYAYAKAIEAENRVSFAEAFTRAFGEVIPRLNDQDAYAVTRWLETSPQVFQDGAARRRSISSGPKTASASRTPWS